MADIALTAAQIAPATSRFEAYTYKAGEALTKGAAVYLKSDGLVYLADGSDATKAVAIGIALSTVGANQPVEVVTRGLVAGFTLSQDYNAPIYVSNTDSGKLADAAGDTSRIIGRVWPTNDGANTKVLFVCPEIV